jgi:hypothetical protein
MNNRATFNDFIYAIVVGSAIAVIDTFTFSWRFAGFILLIAIVLEDLYSYHKFVVPHDPEGKKYRLKSLYFEFAILIAWFASLSSWKDRAYPECVWWLTIFFVIKGLAGSPSTQ